MTTTFYFSLFLKVNKRRTEIPELSMQTSCHENPLTQGQSCLLAFTHRLSFLFNCTFFLCIWNILYSNIQISEMIGCNDLKKKVKLVFEAAFIKNFIKGFTSFSFAFCSTVSVSCAAEQATLGD